MKIGLGRQLDPNRKSSDAAQFEQAIRSKVVGQDAAIEKICEVYQMFMAGLNPPGRPVGNLLFLGPTGTGKTRVVEAMAEVIFGDPRAVIKIDCAEFQHSHEIAKLIGSPPGYLGHRETSPMLSQETINMWHTDKVKLSLVLFDEVEKASDALWNLLLGILDKATLTLGDNKRVDMSRCIIFMTSNLGAGEMQKLVTGGMGFQSPHAEVEKLNAKFDEKINNTAVEAARRRFSPEFMNRLDKIVVFNTLRPEHLKNILEIELGNVQQRILSYSGEHQFVFSCSDKVKDLLLKEGIDPKYGARHLKRTVERRVVFPLSNLLATDQIKLGDFIRIDAEEDGTFTFVTEAEGALVPVTIAKYGEALKQEMKSNLATSSSVDSAKVHLDKANEHLERARKIAESLKKEPREPKPSEPSELEEGLRHTLDTVLLNAREEDVPTLKEILKDVKTHDEALERLKKFNRKPRNKPPKKL